MLFASICFSQNERTFLKSAQYSLYGQTIDLKDKMDEDYVLFTLEMDMKEKLTSSQVQFLQSLMQKDVSTAFVVSDANSNKITFFTTKPALRHIDMFDYCKRTLLLAGYSTDHTGYSQTILEVLKN
jgi:hypothetical protein